MYTRSYPRQEQKKAPPPPVEPFNTSPPHKIFTENEIPEGYSGTAILRENESASQTHESSAQNTDYSAYASPHCDHSRAKKFKVATKITPSLWRSDGNGSATERENSECETSDILSESNLELKNGTPYTDCLANPDTKKDTDLANNCINTGKSSRENRRDEKRYDENGCDKNECDENKYDEDKSEENKRDKCISDEGRCEKEKHIARSRRRRLWRPSTEKHCFKRTPGACLRERSFSLEDLLLGGLILLMLNEGADDDMILIFAFLLFSSL